MQVAEDETASESQETPLPRRQVAVLMCIQLSEALAVNMLYPIVPFMVRRFEEINADDPSEVSLSAPSGSSKDPVRPVV